MNSYTLMAMRDEIEKTAAGWHLRSGKRPISVAKLIAKSSGKVKKAALGTFAGSLKPSGKTLGALAAGAAGYHVLRKANEDRKLGKMVRQQQGQQ